jgi:hypothetical protein
VTDAPRLDVKTLARDIVQRTEKFGDSSTRALHFATLDSRVRNSSVAKRDIAKDPKRRVLGLTVRSL